MNPFLKRARVLALALFLLAGEPSAGFGQEPAAPAAVPGGGALPSTEALRARLEEVREDSTLEEGLKSEMVSRFQEAIVAREEAAVQNALAEAYGQALENGAAGAARVEEERTALVSGERGGAVLEEVLVAETSGLDLQQLEQRLAQERARLAQSRTALGTAEAALNEQEMERPEAIQRELKAAREGLAAAEGKLAEIAGFTGPADVLTEARRVRWQAAREAASARVEALQLEQLSREPRLALLQANRDLLREQVRRNEATVGAMEGLTDVRRRELSQRSMESADQLREATEGESPFVRELAAEISERSEEFEALTARISDLGAERREAARRLANLRETAGRVEQQLAIGGARGAFARILIEERRALPNLRQTRARLEELRGRLSEARAGAFQVDRRLQEIAALQTELELERGGGGGRAGANPAEPAALKLAEILGQTRDAHRRAVEDLVDLSTMEMEYRELVSGYEDFLGDKLFWVPSSPVIGVATLREAPEGMRSLFSGANLGELGKVLRSLPRRSPGLFSLATGFCLILLLGRRRLTGALKEVGLRTRRTQQDRWAYTWMALVLTLLLALPLPLYLGYLGWEIYQVPFVSEWLQGVGDALLWSFLASCSILIVHETACKGGLGEVHFGWNREKLARLQTDLRLLLAGYVPLVGVTIVAVMAGSNEALSSMGRIAFLAAMLWVAWIGYRLTEPGNGILSGLPLGSAGEKRGRFRWAALFLASGIPLALAGLAAAGYFLTAYVLHYRLQLTTCWLAGGPILFGLALRAFSVRERRIALEQVLKDRQQKRQGEPVEAHPDAAGGEVPVLDLSEPRIDLEAVGAQTRSLLRFLIGVGVAVGIWSAWLGSVPALRRLDSLHLVAGVSVGELLAAVLVGFVTHVSARNLPGLLELGLSRTGTMDAGSRSALAKLAVYVVVAFGFTLACNILDVEWSRLGWIAAALSVGLGFGLQEIVANFVCGIILLFERPIRVGDIVTVGEVTGVVSRIQIRATTITDWDRKEFVVPNKEFITGTLKNWTLTDTINRIVIPVGVAYGSDTEKASRILTDVATAHPEVTREPAPFVTFERFADSALILVLRCYLPTLERRLRVMHELHTAIHQRFMAEGIEIAFPQLDVHVRSVPAGGGPSPASPVG